MQERNAQRVEHRSVSLNVDVRATPANVGTVVTAEKKKPRRANTMAERPVFYKMQMAPFGGLKPHEQIDWVYSQSPAGEQTGAFPAPHLASIGVRVPGLGSGFRRGVPPDKIIYAYDPRLPLRDFEPLAWQWVISSAARKVLERFAKDAIDIVEPEVYVRYKNEDRPVKQRWLCDVIRFEDAVDEAASSIAWETKVPQYGVSSRLIFKPELPADLHLFRIWKAPGRIACSKALRDALKAANLSGLVFEKF